MLNLISLLSMVMVMMVDVASGQPPQCQPEYDNVTIFLAAIDADVFFPGLFTQDCVKEACPDLTSSPCPYSTIENVNTILNTVSTCLASLPSLCSTPLSDIPVCDTGLTLGALVPGINGSIYLDPGTVALNGVGQAKFQYDPTTTYFQMTASLVYTGKVKGSVEGFGSFDHDAGTITLDVIATAKIDLSNQDSPVNVISGAVTNKAVHVGSLSSDAADNNATSEYVRYGIEYALDQQVLGDATPNAMGQFLGTILAKALSIAAAASC